MIVGVCGSPRKAATEHVLRETLSMLEKMGFETAFFSIRAKTIKPCDHCDHCLTAKGCRIDDDMEELYGLLKKADGLILATPVYNGGLSAQLKAVIDRTRALVAGDRDFFKRKVGMAIAVGGDRAGGQEMAIQQILTFYILNGMVPASGGAFGANMGACFWSKDTLEDVKADEEGFRSLKKTVKRFAEYMRIEAARMRKK